MQISITKSSGLKEHFAIEKLVESLVRSGASEDAAWDIARKVEKKITPDMKTKTIFRIARRFLHQRNRVSGMKYSIKHALSLLGPSGYPFEKYFGKILHAHGYEVEMNRIIDGYCVKHEVDVFAKKDDRDCVIECKYHSNGGNATDVKIALYVHSRFLDIKKACEQKALTDKYNHEGWLVTNTRCTTDAIKYAECTGLKIVSWRYPDKDSLERMIEVKRLYPVTVLPAASKKTLDALLRNEIIMAEDIANMDAELLRRRSGLDSETAFAIKKEADTLCPCGK